MICHKTQPNETNDRELSLPYTSSICVRWSEKRWINAFTKKIRVKWSTNSSVQDLKLGSPIPFATMITILLSSPYSALCHHHHHIVLAARISLTLSRHSSLSFIALGRSSGQQPVSSHSCWMYVRAGRPAFARPCIHPPSLSSVLLLPLSFH